MSRRRHLIVGLLLINLVAAVLTVVLLLNAERPEEGTTFALVAWHRELILLFVGASALATLWLGALLAHVTRRQRR